MLLSLIVRQRGAEVAMASELLPIVSNILFYDWDPIGINSFEQCRDEYDGYVPVVVHWLLSGTDERELSSRLSQIQRSSMGMSIIDEELHRRVARRLLGLVTGSI